MIKSLLPNLYAHRGFHNSEIKENSIESLDNAYKNFFYAIEFDIWLKNDELIISHDKPKNSNEFFYPNLKNFLKYQNHFKYWLDFKNIDLNNVDKVLKLIKLNLELQKIDLKTVIFAPYINNYDLALKIFYKFKNFFGEKKCNYALICDETVDIHDVYRIFSLHKIDFLSIYHRLINPDLLKKISPEKILSWTVNDEKILNDLLSLGVKNFATDKILP